MAENDEVPAPEGLMGWLKQRRVKRLARERQRAELEGSARQEVDRLLGSQPPTPPQT